MNLSAQCLSDGTPDWGRTQEGIESLRFKEAPIAIPLPLYFPTSQKCSPSSPRTMGPGCSSSPIMQLWANRSCCVPVLSPSPLRTGQDLTLKAEDMSTIHW